MGTINGVIEYESGRYYKAIFAASTPYHDLATALGWEYDAAKLNIPSFFVAGTGSVDFGNEEDSGIAPLLSLKENYERLPNDAVKLYARRANTDQGDMLANADGYMTAWFMYRLKNDTEAAKVFVGDTAEILNNANWQDTVKNN